MLIVDSLLVGGIKFVLTRIAEAVEAEAYDETALREELLAAQMRLELGEITEEDFVRVEEQVLAGLREVRARREAANGGAERGPTDGVLRVESVEASLGRSEGVD